MMLSRLGVLNALLTFDVFNLQWVYLDVTPSEAEDLCSASFTAALAGGEKSEPRGHFM